MPPCVTPGAPQTYKNTGVWGSARSLKARHLRTILSSSSYLSLAHSLRTVQNVYHSISATCPPLPQSARECLPFNSRTFSSFRTLSHIHGGIGVHYFLK